MWSGAILEVLEAENPGHGVTADRIRPFLQTGFPWHEPHRTRDPGIHPDEWWRALHPVFLRAYCDGARIGLVEAQRLAEMVRKAYVNPARWALFSDMLPCLTTLSSSGWKHVILSNHCPELAELVRALGIASYFDAIFNSAKTGAEKPNPRAFQNVLASLPETKEVWVIGDSVVADVNGARSVGLRSVLVRKPHPDAEIFCETLDELPAMLSV